MTEQERRRREARKRFNESGHPALEYGKVPPSASDLEEVVLGAMMIDPMCIRTVRSILSPEMFYKDAHQKVCKAVYQLYDERKPVDILTVTNQLRTNGELEIVGGAYVIGQLTDKVSSGANSEFHSRIIYEKYIAREVISISSEAIKKAFDDTEDVFEVKNELSMNISNLTTNEKKVSVGVSDLKREFFDRQEKLDKCEITSIPTGLGDFDKINGGLQKTDLIVIASFESNGKSLTALNILHHAAEKGHFGKYYSLEMGVRQLYTRQVAMESNQNSRDINIGLPYDREAVRKAIEKIDGHKSKYCDKLFHIRDIKNDIVYEVTRNGLEFCIIDYAQLVHYDQKSRAEGVGYVGNSLKALANELNIPIILISQLRRPETPKPPSMDMIKETGDISNSANIVLLPWIPIAPPCKLEEIEFKGEKLPTTFNDTRLMVFLQEKGRDSGLGKWFGYVNSSLKIKNSVTTSNSFHMMEKQTPIMPNDNFDSESPF